MFYIADLYDVLNFLFNAAIWIFMIFCLINIIKYLKKLMVKSANASIDVSVKGAIGLFSFLKAEDIQLRVKIIYLAIGALFTYVVLAAVIQGFN